MMIAAITKKMISFYSGNLHDICHFLKVYAYAKTIGELESLDSDTLLTLEISAIVHDIACPLCRERHGRALGECQELEGPDLAAEFLKEFSLPSKIFDRVCYIVGRHHTYTDVDGLDYQILLEADFLVNADEGKASKVAITNMLENVFKTASGKDLLKTIYKV